ncbi:MAG TPA: hypothetical protein VLM17_11025 [Xanthomonadaceae bacterium]|nr:hypothetical protein [Xanthomonadaceae bacterium]
MHHHHADPRPDRRVDPRLDHLLRRLIACGVLAVLVLPAARGSSAWLGWWPLWLVAMPLSAWCALHRFALPQRARSARAFLPRRRRGVQARRRATGRPVFARAA